MRKGRNARRGATLLDLLLTVTLFAIVTVAAIPRLRQLLDSIAVRGAASEAHVLFTAARHLALHRATSVTVELDATRALVRLRAGDDTLRVRELGAVHGVELFASRPAMTYAPNGLGYGAANLTLIVSRGAVADTLTVSRLGRIKR